MDQDSIKHFDESDIYYLLGDLWMDILQATHGNYVTDEDPPTLEILDGTTQPDPKPSDGWEDIGVREGVLQVWLRENTCKVRAQNRSLLANTHEGQEEVLSRVITQWKLAFEWARDEYVINQESKSQETPSPSFKDKYYDGRFNLGGIDNDPEDLEDDMIINFRLS